MGVGAVVGGGLGFMVGMAAKAEDVHDKRELYILIEDSDWGTVVKCPPKKGEAARSFAQQLNIAARNALSPDKRIEAIDQARQAVAEAASGALRA